MPVLDNLDIFQEPRLKMLKDSIKEAKNENERLQLAKAIFDELRRGSSNIVDQLQDGVTIDNMDEIKASFHNEFKRNTKLLLEGLRDLKLSNEEQSRIVSALTQKESESFGNDIQTVHIKRSRDRVQVTNLDELSFPKDLSVNNLQELEKYFNDLSQVISQLKLTVPAPRVNVPAPIVNIPETKLPDMDFGILNDRLKKVSDSLIKLKNNKATNPLAVRFSDGAKFIDKITTEIGRVQTALAGFSDRIKLVNNKSQIIDFESMLAPKLLGTGTTTVTTAGTAVQVSATNTPCKFIMAGSDEVNTGGLLAIGDSNVVAAQDGQRGVLIPGPEPRKIETDNLTSLWVDSQSNGDKLCYAYFG